MHLVLSCLSNRKVQKSNKGTKSTKVFQQVKASGKPTIDSFFDKPLVDCQQGQLTRFGENLTGKALFDHSDCQHFVMHLLHLYPQLSIPGVSAKRMPGSNEAVDSFPKLKNYLSTHDVENDNMAFIINTSNHYVMLFIDRKTRTLEYYNSMGGKAPSACKEIASLLNAKDPGTPYTVKTMIKEQLQHDGYQCGPWACFFLDQRLKNPDFDFNSLSQTFSKNEIAEMIALYRNQIILHISEFQSLWNTWDEASYDAFLNHYPSPQTASQAKREARDNYDESEIIRKIFEGTPLAP